MGGVDVEECKQDEYTQRIEKKKQCCEKRV